MSSGLLDEDGEIPARVASLLDGLDGGQRCQTTGQVHSPLTAPWRGDRREVAKTRLFKYVRTEPHGLPLAKVVRDVFGADAVATAGADYQVARRFFGGCEWFKIARRGGSLWVEPTFEAYLCPQYAGQKNARGDGDRVSNGSAGDLTAQRGDSTGDCHGLDETGDRPQYPKDRVRAILNKRLVVDGSDGGHDYREGFLRELDAERDIQQDKYAILRLIRGHGAEYLCKPYETRYNDAGRAQDVRERFEGPLSRARDRHDVATVLTLTTDAKRFSSVSEALDNLSAAVNNLRSWLRYRVGSPDSLKVLEFTDSGLPHVHLVLFGHSRDELPSESKLSDKWSDYGQGYVVDKQQAISGQRQWFMHDDDEGIVSLRYYLGKAVRGLCRLAESDAGDLVDAVEGGDISLWRQCLYWATERRYTTCSPSLRDTDSDEGLPHVTRYEFVGAAQYRDIPGHVRRNAVILDGDRPPPRSGRTAGTAAD